MTRPASGQFHPTPVWREKRRHALARVWLTPSGTDGPERETLVENISARGFSATGPAPAPVGALVAARLPDGRRLSGVVRWAEAARFGIEFVAFEDGAADPSG